MKSESKVEKVTGHLAANLGAALLATAGTPLAALLPVLNSALASERHKQRVADALREIDALLHAHEACLRQLTDAQYKIVCESVVALLQTVEQRKIDYLKTAIRQALFLHEVSNLEADGLARILRDISAAEAKFLLDNPQVEAIHVGDPKDILTAHTILIIPKGDPRVLIVSGLMSMGLLIPSEAAWDTSNRMMLSPICNRLRALLSE